MATDLSFMEYVAEQMGSSGAISYRKMFGEYAVYYYGKVVAFVCDNQLFVKPTAAGKAMLGSVDEAAPYPGGKLHFRITDQLDDRPWLSALVALTAADLPEPKEKKPSASARKKRT